MSSKLTQKCWQELDECSCRREGPCLLYQLRDVRQLQANREAGKQLPGDFGSLSLHYIHRAEDYYCLLNMAAMKMSLTGTFAPSASPLLRAHAKLPGECQYFAGILDSRVVERVHRNVLLRLQTEAVVRSKGCALALTCALGFCSPEEQTADAMLRFQPLSHTRMPQVASGYFRFPHGAQSTANAGATSHALLPLLAFLTSATLHIK